MNTPKKPPSPPPRRAPDTLPPYDALDPIPQPDVTEKNTDTTWELWHDVHSKEQARYADTMPLTMPGAVHSQRPDSQQPGAPLRPATSSGTSGFEKLVEESRRNNRVCPQLAEWAALDQILRAAPGADQGDPLTPVPDAREWKAITPIAKRLTFRAVIDWAAHHGQIEPALRFVRALPEDRWQHMGD